MSQWLCNFDKWRHCKLVVCIRHLISLHQQSSKWTSIPSVLYLSPNLWNVTHNSHYNECRAMDTSLYDPMRFVSFVLSFIFLFGLFCFPPALHLLQWNLPTDDSVPYVIHLVACAVRSVWHLIDYYHYGTKVITLDLQWVAMLFLQMIIIIVDKDVTRHLFNNTSLLEYPWKLW